MPPLTIRHFIKAAIFTTWVVLLAILLTRDLFIPDIGGRGIPLLQKARQQQFYGVWFEDRRIGYVEEVLQPRKEGYDLRQKARLLLNVLETTQPIDMKVRATLTGGLLLQDFDFTFRSPFYSMSARGYVEGSSVYFTLDTGQSKVTDMITLSGPPLLAVNDKSYLLRELKETGQKMKIPSFDPVSLNGRESIVTYLGKEKLLVRRRLKVLHHFTENTGGMRINFWLDDEGRIVREESPAGFRFIAEPEFRAKDIVSSGNELLSAVAVPLKGVLPEQNATSIRYKLLFPPDLDLDLAGGRQQFANNTMTIALEHLPSTVATTSEKECSGPRFLEPSRYVQSRNKQITNLAGSIVGDETDPARQVRLLAAWVYENIEKRPVLGLPDALTTLNNRQGDCNEHASLFAALARNLGINTAIATGVTLQNDAFYYHAWNEVCLEGRWFSLDTTTHQLPADLFHIRFGRGDMEEQLKIGGLLGKLQIEILPQ